jgi:hypothetical protein
MRKEHKSETGGLTEAGRRHFEAKEGGNLQRPVSSGTNPRRVSFAARFAAQNHPMKGKDGKPTRYALALKKWGFSSPAQARAFAKRNRQEA